MGVLAGAGGGKIHLTEPFSRPLKKLEQFLSKKHKRRRRSLGVMVRGLIMLKVRRLDLHRWGKLMLMSCGPVWCAPCSKW